MTQPLKDENNKLIAKKFASNSIRSVENRVCLFKKGVFTSG
ncbi:hypothetical protein CHCC20347_4278 [Bacillus paralicheniformis]|nr:hypothetical protein CHCC20347_4278 [Bacillus paralicheniformis]